MQRRALHAPADPHSPAPASAGRRARAIAAPRPDTAAASAAKPERILVGALALLASTALFPVSDVAAKMLTTGLPAIEVVWLRYLVFVIMTVPVLVRGRAALATRRPGLQFGRALASAGSTAIAIVSFSFLPVAESTAIGFVAPVIVTAMAAAFLGEKVGLRRWVAAIVGLVGVLIIVQPGSGAFRLVSLIPLAGSIVGALSTVTTRMAKDERPETTLLYSAVIGFAILSVMVALQWQTPTWPQVAIGGFVGFFAAVASLMQVFAYRHAPASILAPFSYTQLIWAGALGFAVFGTVPGAAMLAGAAVIAASGIYTAWRESVKPDLSRPKAGAA